MVSLLWGSGWTASSVLHKVSLNSLLTFVMSNLRRSTCVFPEVITHYSPVSFSKGNIGFYTFYRHWHWLLPNKLTFSWESQFIWPIRWALKEKVGILWNKLLPRVKWEYLCHSHVCQFYMKVEPGDSLVSLV